MILMAKMKQRKMNEARRRQAPRRKEEDPNTHLGSLKYLYDKESDSFPSLTFSKNSYADS